MSIKTAYKTPLILRGLYNSSDVSYNWVSKCVKDYWQIEDDVKLIGRGDTQPEDASFVLEAFTTSWTWDEVNYDPKTQFCGGELIFPEIVDSSFFMMYGFLPRANDIIIYPAVLKQVVAPIRFGTRTVEKFWFK